MAVYQFFNPASVFLDLNGLQLAANGSLTFYDVGTTTNRTTWSDHAQTTPNTNPVVLGPDARSPVQIFMEGDYTVIVKDSLGAVVKTFDVYSPTEAGNTIPALVNGAVLTNDGTNLLWAEMLQIPDPTGSTSHYLTTDGANLIWSSIPTPPTIPDLEIVVAANSFRAGVSTNTTKWLVQSGASSAPSSGAFTTTHSVSFPTAFSATPIVMLIPTSNSNPGGPVVWNLTAKSATGFTAQFDIAEGTSSGASVVNAIPYDWIAFGTVVVTP